jgi:hypothetical protein
MNNRRVVGSLALLLATALIAAGCGGDDDEEATTPELPGAAQAAALQEEIADLSDEEQIKRVGAAWAEPFAAGEEEMCAYMHSDLVPAPESCTAVTGTSVDPQQRSYAGATVKGVTIEDETATAEFSNGELVEFQRDPDGAWRIIAPP